MSKIMLDIDHISKTFNPGTVNEKLAMDDLSPKMPAKRKVLPSRRI